MFCRKVMLPFGSHQAPHQRAKVLLDRRPVHATCRPPHPAPFALAVDAAVREVRKNIDARPLGSQGFKCPQHSPTTRPAVKRTAEKADELSTFGATTFAANVSSEKRGSCPAIPTASRSRLRPLAPPPVQPPVSPPERPHRSLDPLDFNFSRHSPTTRPSVERTAEKAFLLSDRV